MKKQILFILVALVAGFSTMYAQGPQRRTVEERVQIAHQKFDSAFKLEKSKITEADSAFAAYYRAMDKLREEMQPGTPPPDRSKFEGPARERDKKLETILTPDQYKIWKEEIEPTMRGSRRGGGRNR